MKLSICIPGYNRPDFLSWTLDKLEEDFPEAEIIVSDDASTEDMSSVRYDKRVRWIDQKKNLGAFANLRSVLIEARGEYAVYCANDDYLLPERLSEITAYMDSHKEISAYIAPCEIWDEVKGKAFWNAFKCKETTFHVEQGIDLFNFIIENHVWPEHIVYRTPVPYKPFTRAFWCYASLIDLLRKGPIFFDPRPFYRNVLVHPVGERVQLGNVQCLTYFDEYRAGLEVLAYELFGEQPYRARHQIQEMISAFICQRMYNASVLYERAGHMLDAQMLRKRITIANPSRAA